MNTKQEIRFLAPTDDEKLKLRGIEGTGSPDSIEDAKRRTSNNTGSQEGGVKFHSNQSLVKVRKISKVCDWENPEEKFASWHTKQEHKERMNSLRREIQEFQLNRRLSDNKTFTTVGLLDKVKGTPRHITKKTLRESAWNAVIFQQYDLRREQQKHLEHHLDSIDNTGSYEGDDDCKKTSNDEQSEIIASAYHDTSQIAQTIAYQQAKKVHRDIQFDAAMNKQTN